MPIFARLNADGCGLTGLDLKYVLNGIDGVARHIFRRQFAPTAPRFALDRNFVEDVGASIEGELRAFRMALQLCRKVVLSVS